MLAPISVLLPVYNGLATVGRAVESVLAQSHPELELVIVDDGSTDGTSEYLRTLHDRRVRLLRHPENRGLVAALNRGLDACSHELVARLDADDAAGPRRLERQVAVFQSAPEVVLISAAYQRVDEAGSPAGVGMPPLTHAAMAAGLLVGNRISHSTVAFRRSAVLAVGGYDPDWFPVEDYDLWLRLLTSLGEYRGMSSIEATCTVSTTGISATHDVRQREKAHARAASYRSDLLGGAGGTGSPTSVREIELLVRALRDQLRQRHISTSGLYRQARILAYATTTRRTPVGRRLELLARAPALTLRALLDR